MRRLVALLTFVILIPVASAAGGGAGTPDSSRRPLAQKGVAAAAHRVAAVAALEREVFVTINEVRRAHGLRELRLNRRLAAAARGHSQSMARHGFFAHASYDGSSFWLRIESVYPSASGRFWCAGENIVWAAPGLSARKAVGLWLKSREHREILLAPEWHDLGVGGVHALDAPGAYHGLDVTILTADFGAR